MEYTTIGIDVSKAKLDIFSQTPKKLLQSKIIRMVLRNFIS